MLITNVVRPPGATRLLLLAHGYGADERDLGGLLPYLDPEGRFVTVMPRAPLAAPGTPGFSWFDLGPDGADPGAVHRATDQLDELLDAQCAEHGLSRAEAVVGGFSQGAGLALLAALRRRADGGARPAGVLAMSPFAPAVALDELDAEAVRSVPILLQHGTEDPLIPVKHARALAEALAARGAPLVYEEYPMEHQVALESVQAARAWLERILAGETPAAPIPEPPPEGPVRAVTTATFDTEVLRSDVPVIVDFWAPWCAPCRQVAPVVEQIALMRQGSYKVVKVNIDEEPTLAQTYGVQSIPMIALFRNGRLERASLGAKPRPQLEAELGMLVIP